LVASTQSLLGSSRPVGFVSESGTHRHYDNTTAMPWRNLKWTAPLVPELMGTAELDRPTALVTGANRGLGLETFEHLRANGFTVILTSRDEKKGTASARGLDPAGRDVAYHQLDITDAASISAVAHDLPGLASRLDLLVNNAGVGSSGADRRGAARAIAPNYFRSRDVSGALLPFTPAGGRL